MKKTLILLTSLAVTIGVLTVVLAQDGKPAVKVPGKRGPLVHMVAFKFNPDTKKEKIREVEKAFAALKEKIPQIVSFEWGTNVSPEKHDKGFTHGFILTFADGKDRDDYLAHPAHQEFGKLVGGELADVFVIDFWAKETAEGR